MKHSSEKPLAPANYSRCFNNQCPKADNCLHRLAALRDTPEYPSIRIINPLCIPEDSSQCAYFQSTQKIHVAWGISHLLDEVPYKNLQPLKSQLIAHFGRGKYYRFSRNVVLVESSADIVLVFAENTTASTGKNLTFLPFVFLAVRVESRFSRNVVLVER